MKYIKEPILSGKSVTYNVAGRVFLIDAITGTGSTIDVQLLKGGSSVHILPGRKPLFKCVTDFDSVVLTATADVTVAFFISTEDVNIGTNDLRINNTVGDPVNVLFSGTVAPVLGNVTVNNASGSPVPTYFPTTQSVNVGTMPNVTIAALPATPWTGSPSVSLAATPWTGTPNIACTSVPPNQTVLSAPQALTTSVTLAQASVGVAAGSVLNDATLKRVIFTNANTTGGSNIYLGGSTVTVANAAIVLTPGSSFIDTMGAASNWYAIADIAASKLNIQTLK